LVSQSKSQTMNSVFCDINSIRKMEVCESMKWNEMLDVNQKMYVILVEWIVSLNKVLKYHIKTLFSAVRLISLLLNRKTCLPRSMLQLYGMTCLYISAKLEELRVGDIQEYITMSDDAFTKEQMVEAEKDIVKTLKRLRYPTVYDFLQIYSNGGCDSYSIYLGIISLSCFEILNYSQEEQALALLSLVNKNITVTDRIRLCASLLYSHYKGIDQRSDFCTTYAKMNPLGSWNTSFNLLCLPPQQNLETDNNTATYNKSPKTESNNNENFYLIPPKSCSFNYKVGGGTYGVVRKVTRNGETLAMKKSRSDEDGLSISFLRELSVYSYFSTVSHEQVTKSYGFYLDGRKEYIFLEHAQKDLKSFLDANYSYFSNNSRLLEASKQLCRGLEAMHSLGIMHRDIKPQNILVFGTQEKLVLKYCDFGMARIPGPITECNVFTDVVSTLWYRPPEVFSYSKKGRIIYGPEVDMWSLSCVLAEMITNNAIFQSSGESEQLACIISHNMDDILEFSKEYAFHINALCMKRKELVFPSSLAPQIKEVIKRGLKLLPEKRISAKAALEVLNCCSDI